MRNSALKYIFLYVVKPPFIRMKLSRAHYSISPIQIQSGKDLNNNINDYQFNREIDVL